MANLPIFETQNSEVIKIIVWTLGIVLGVLILTSTGFYLLQEKFIFQGTVLSKDYAFQFDQEFQEYFIPVRDGATLNALLFNASSPSKGLILYFHGNADNLQRWGQYAVDFTSRGYDILIIDYRGYGKSTGSPSEAMLYQDALTVWSWSRSNIPATRLVIYGRSLGSAVATQLATMHEPDLLILETPFDEMSGTLYKPIRSLISILPLRSQFPNKVFLAKVTCKTIIIHGTEDWVVPLESALRLKPLLKEGDRFIIIDGGGHRNLQEFDAFQKTLSEALQ